MQAGAEALSQLLAAAMVTAGHADAARAWLSTYAVAAGASQQAQAQAYWEGAQRIVAQAQAGLPRTAATVCGFGALAPAAPSAPAPRELHAPVRDAHEVPAAPAARQCVGGTVRRYGRELVRSPRARAAALLAVLGLLMAMRMRARLRGGAVGAALTLLRWLGEFRGLLLGM